MVNIINDNKPIYIMDVPASTFPHNNTGCIIHDIHQEQDIDCTIIHTTAVT